MSHGTPAPVHSSSDPWIGRINAIFGFVILIFQIYLASKTHDTEKRVESVQNQVEEKSSEIQNRQKEVKQAVQDLPQLAEDPLKVWIKEGSQLFTNYIYLQERANDSGDPKDKEEAAKAKRILDEHNKKKPVPTSKSRPGEVP